MGLCNLFMKEDNISFNNIYNRLKPQVTQKKPKDKNVDISLCLLSVALAGLAYLMLRQNGMSSTSSTTTTSGGGGRNRRKRELHNYN